MTAPEGSKGSVRPEGSAGGAGGPPLVGGDRPRPLHRDRRGFGVGRVLPWVAVISVCTGLFLVRARDMWTTAQAEGLGTMPALWEAVVGNWFLLLPIVLALVPIIPVLRDMTEPFWGEERSHRGPGIDN